MNPALYIIPALLLGFFAWKGIREPVYFVGIPLIVALNRAVFLDLYSLNVDLGFFDLRQEDVLFLVLLATYVLVRLIRRETADRRMTLHFYLIIALLVILVAKVFARGVTGVGDLASPGHAMSAIKSGLEFQLRVLFYLPLTLLLWRGVLRRFSRAEMVRLFSAMTFVTAGCAVLYVANLVGLPIYTGIWSTYLTETVGGGTTLFRDYVILPFWLNLALGFSLAQLVFRVKVAIYLPIALVVTACAALSFTRMFVMSALALWGVTLLWWLFRVLRYGQVGRLSSAKSGKAAVVFAVAAVEVAFGFILVRLSTLASLGGYLMERFGEMAAGTQVDPNIAIRTNLYSIAFRTIQKDGLWLGVLTPVGQVAGVYFLDSYWSQALVSLGLLGVLCVGVLALDALVKAGRQAVLPAGKEAHFGLAVFLALLMALLASISNAGFMYSVAASMFVVAVAVTRFRPDPTPPADITSPPEGE